MGKQGALTDIKVKVNIADSAPNTVKIVEDTASKNNYQLVVKPIDFEIRATTGEKTVDVSRFNAYVERMVAIPDGTFTHVPTTIIVIGGKYYARINSLTNSTYSVVYAPKTFADVEKHWSKDAVNNMASRLVIKGKSDTTFAPNDQITRAETAAMVERLLKQAKLID